MVKQADYFPGHQPAGTRWLREDSGFRKEQADARWNRERLVEMGKDNYIRQSVAHHVERRFDATARLFVLAAKSVRHGLITGSDELYLVTRGPTTVQAFRSDETGFHAAHVLPCQALFGGHYPWQLPGTSQRYQLTSIQLYGDCTKQPAIVNSVENFVDNNWRAAQNMIRALNEIRRGRPPLTAFTDWSQDLIAVLRTADPRYVAEMLGHFADPEEAIGAGMSVSRQMYAESVHQVLEAYGEACGPAFDEQMVAGHLQSRSEFSHRMDEIAQPVKSDSSSAAPAAEGASPGSGQGGDPTT